MGNQPTLSVAMGDFVDLLGDGRLLKRPVRPGAGAAPTAAPSAHVAVRYETRVVTDGPLGPAGEVPLGQRRGEG